MTKEEFITNKWKEFTKDYELYAKYTIDSIKYMQKETDEIRDN